ncbi:aminoglycoside phosphotransferase family protein [Exiguobacterium sp. H66]|uniref:aminoglycoside phosphotransferase family protein n=1 Tax=Exiguobacterium sp. H66 TaxID=2751208 RepID=UPI001BE6A473|nr:aminoglycoside phosphotransferase family protein [Exiguobacterium sp. H66]
MDREEIKQNIGWLRSATRIEPLTIGYSSYPKFYVINGQREYVLQFMDGTRFAWQRELAENVQTMSADGLPVVPFVEVGRLSAHSAYSIRPYFRGNDARTELATADEATAYKLGIEAGRVLAALHGYVAPASVAPWAERCQAKHERYVTGYRSSGVEFEQAEQINAWVEQQIPRLANRPNRFQHDDFHPGNLIVRDGSLVGVIDFDQADYGDPWHDFVKLGLFTVEQSIPFARGQLRGYFDGPVPDVFWDVYGVYMAMALFSALVWTVRNHTEEVAEMTNRLTRILAAHDNFSRRIPVWYTG